MVYYHLVTHFSSSAEIINMARYPGTSVSCSSALNTDYRCEKVVDGDTETTGEWASDRESDGAWVKVSEHGNIKTDGTVQANDIATLCDIETLYFRM